MKLFYRAIAVILIFCLLSGMADVLAAADAAFTGHWAEASLNKA